MPGTGRTTADGLRHLRHSHFPAKPQGELSAQGQAERDSTD